MSINSYGNTIRKKYKRRRAAYIKFFEFHVCHFCKVKLINYGSDGMYHDDRLTIDHLKPLIVGGDPTSFDNFRLSCEKCNRLRSTISNQLEPIKKQNLIDSIPQTIHPDFFKFILGNNEDILELGPHHNLKKYLKYMATNKK